MQVLLLSASECGELHRARGARKGGEDSPIERYQSYSRFKTNIARTILLLLVLFQWIRHGILVPTNFKISRSDFGILLHLLSPFHLLPSLSSSSSSSLLSLSFSHPLPTVIVVSYYKQTTKIACYFIFSETYLK